MTLNFFTPLKRLTYKNESQQGAGGLVFYGGKLLLINRGTPYNDWVFPKGKAEGEKNLARVAKREIKEEVGLDVEIVKKIGENNYSFYVDEKKLKVINTVHFYLCFAKTNRIRLQPPRLGKESSTFVSVKWVDPKEAVKLVKFRSHSQLIQKAIRHLENK